MKRDLTIFEEYEIRRVYDEETETWYFSVIDIIRVLTQQSDYQTARKYWNKLKERLKNEGGDQVVTKCNHLKLANWNCQEKYLLSLSDRTYNPLIISGDGQNLKAYEKFAEMIEKHWSGIASHCVLGEGIKLGYVEGLNNKIRVFQRRAYGIKDEKYPRLKILTFKLKPL